MNIKKFIDSKITYVIGWISGLYLVILAMALVVGAGIFTTMKILSISKNELIVLPMMVGYLILMRFIISLLMKYVVKRAKLGSVDFRMVRDILRALVFIAPVIVFLCSSIKSSMSVASEMKIIIMIYGIYLVVENNIKRYLRERKNQI